ncbi:MAG TPA: MarR family winged helix-turn-helix transcriptional regulator [Gaiellaceae bacterium]|nr:MarR family winged helix-turn-helix transcriptional regulator [Gaiellaceae bacterium]
MSSNLPPEPDSFSPEEFAAWRGLLRLRESVTRALDGRLRADHGLSLDDYGILITLVGQPGARQRMSALGEQRLLTPSGITRAVARLEGRGLLRRGPDPADGRAFFATLTPKGVRELRRAQRTHHAIVRELYLSRLDAREVAQLGALFEKAVSPPRR